MEQVTKSNALLLLMMMMKGPGLTVSMTNYGLAE
jgi:hypothetical protein